MNHLAIARHGRYDRKTGNLTNDGRDDFTELSERLRIIIPEPRTVRVLSSPAPRALESAAITGTAFGTKPIVEDLLFSGQDPGGAPQEENLPAALDLIRQNSDADTLILVTHLEYAIGLPVFFAQQVLEEEIEGQEIKCSQAYYFDLARKRIMLIPN